MSELNLRWPDDPTRQAPPYPRRYGGADHPQASGFGGSPAGDASLPLRRMLARVVDWLFLLLVTSPIWEPIVRPLSGAFNAWVASIPPGTSNIPAPPPGLMDQLAGRGYQITLLWTLTGFFYETVLYALWGRTLGKLVAGVRVARVARPADSGRGVGWAAAAARAAVYRFPSLVPFGFLFWLVNVTWLLWDRPNRQALHDKAAQTVVVRTRRHQT